MEHLQFLISNFYVACDVLLWITAGIALWRGAGPERASAGTMFLLLITDDIYHLIYGPFFPLDRADPWHVAIDTLALVALVIVALKANRFYPMVLAAAQLVSVTAHIVRLAVPQMTSLSYYLLYVMPFYFAVLVLAGGLWRHHARVRRIGRYPDWRPVASRGSAALANRA